MAYNDITDRTGGGALVPPEHSNKIIKQATQMSAALAFMKRMPIVTNQKSFPVLSGLPTAYWLDPTATPTSDDTALIQTTAATWKNVIMNVSELGVIAPMPRRYVDDAKAGGINVTEEMIPILAQAVALTLDSSIFFGVNKPVIWPEAVALAALAAGNQHEAVATAADGGLHADIINMFKLIRADGFRPNAAIGRGTFEFDLLNARDTTGQPLMLSQESPVGPNVRNLLGRNVLFETDGVFPADAPGAAQLVTFDSTKHLIGVRKDMEITVHKEGVIQDATNAIVYNLMQQDMVAVRLLMRVGYTVANPVTVAQPTEASRYPGGVLISDDGV